MSINISLYRNTNQGNRLDGAYPLGDAPADVSNITDIGSNRFRITGTGFGTKPYGATAKVLVDADLGINGFHPTLSRDQAWQSTPLGEVSTAQVSSGSIQSLRYDLSLGGSALAEHTLDTTPTKLLCYRRKYEDFDVTVDYVRRTRITAGTGGTGGQPSVWPSAGDTVTGTTTGATGIVQSVVSDGGGTRIAVFYEPTGGTINDPVGGGRIIFQNDEEMTWPAGTGYCNEGDGTLEGFNNKQFRVWGARGTGTQHDVIIAAGAIGPTGDTTNGNATTTTEQVTNSPTTPTDSRRKQQEDANTWIGESMFIVNSSLDTQDGVVEWWKNSYKLFRGLGRATRSTSRPELCNEVVMHEVSNGCQPGSYIYYSYVLIDDSHYFVTAWNSDRTDHAILPVVSWTDTEIVVEDMGAVNWTTLDVHVDSLEPAFTGARP